MTNNIPSKPEYGEFQTAEWREDIGAWWIRDLTPEELAIKFPPPPPPPPPTLLEYAATKRWNTETGGITVGGIPVYTDDRSKLMVMGARIRAAADPTVIEKWAAADGNVYDLDAATIIMISDAIAAHVSACFAKFAEVKAAITAETITDYTGIDAAFATVGQ
jgi:hypothetical protein